MMTTGRKLAIAGLIVASVTGYMAYVGASASWQYYVTVDECLAGRSELLGCRIRVNGKIVPNSLQVAADRSQANFLLAGTRSNLQASYSGPLPDNLAQTTEVVVEGRLDDSGLLRGDKLLTRCAGKYKSREFQGTSPDPPSTETRESP